MRPRFFWLCGATFLALAAPVSRAEVPLLGPEQLRRDATHVFVGTVKEVYRSVERGGDFEETRGVAEVLVDRAEKGEGPKAGGVAYVRFWNQRWVGQGGVPPPHSGGHHVPPKGAAVRVFAKRAGDGGYEALLPNGLTPMSARP